MQLIIFSAHFCSSLPFSIWSNACTLQNPLDSAVRTLQYLQASNWLAGRCTRLNIIWACIVIFQGQHVLWNNFFLYNICYIYIPINVCVIYSLLPQAHLTQALRQNNGNSRTGRRSDYCRSQNVGTLTRRPCRGSAVDGFHRLQSQRRLQTAATSREHPALLIVIWCRDGCCPLPTRNLIEPSFAANRKTIQSWPLQSRKSVHFLCVVIWCRDIIFEHGLPIVPYLWTMYRTGGDTLATHVTVRTIWSTAG